MKISEQIKWFSKNGYKVVRLIFIMQITITILHILFNNPYLLWALFSAPEFVVFGVHILVIILQFLSVIGIIWYLITLIIYKRQNENFKNLLIFGIISTLIMTTILIIDLYDLIKYPYDIIQYYLGIINIANLVVLFLLMRKLHVNNQIFL